MAQEHELIVKLDGFIRKYYKNRMIRGFMWVCALMGAFFLFLVAFEYFFFFSQLVRTVLFFTFLGLSLFTTVRLVLIPFLQLMRIGRVISHDQAAMIIGKYFNEIQDKLLNTLQLIRQQENDGAVAELLAAGIEQKTRALKVFRFNIVIDFRKNLRYLYYALVPLMIIIAGILFSPKTISDPAGRIMHFNKAFVKPLPYQIEVLTRNITAVQQEDVEIRVRATGEEIPAEIFVKSGDISYKMRKERGFIFSCQFKSVQANILYRIVTGDYRSDEYEIRVFPKPIILNFDILASYPAYINKPQETLENTGDLSVPEGTVLTWNFHTKDVRSIRFRQDRELISLINGNLGVFSHSARVLSSFSYCISPVNESTFSADSLNFRINAISDGFPSVFMVESADSALATSLFFKGTIKDDYGFSKLTFNYKISLKNDTASAVSRVEPIAFDKSVNNQVFYYTVDLMKVLPLPGQQIQYNFEVWDNDGIHGPKATRSELKTISTPGLEEIANQTTQNEKSINLDLEKSLSDSKALKKNMEELNKKLVDQSSLTWQDKKKIEDLIRANKDIEDKVDQTRKKNQQNIANEEKYLETSDRIIEKQKQLQQLMDQMLTEEMKKMIQEMKDLLNQVDKTKLASLLEKMKMSNKELETQLDRNLALMKQIEFDRKLEETVKELRKTAEDLEKLAAATEKGEKSKEDLLKEQQKINQRADSLAVKLKSLDKLGKELETPADLGNAQQKQDSINKNLAESENQLQGNKQKEAAGSQKKAAKQMKELAKQMEDSQEESEDSQMAEDESNIRMILENLVRLSFDQEDMIVKTRVIARNDPKFTELVFRQKEFGEKVKVVEDSLNAVAKRQVMIKPIVSKEIASIRKNIGSALDALDNHNIGQAVINQQFSMTSINNLAVLLDEALQKMNEQSAMSMKTKSGSKQCKKPSGKGGKMSAKSMKDIQKQIGKQLEKLKAGMEKSGKPGEGSKQAQSGMNKEIAKLAAEQEALRNEMQKYQDEQASQGLKNQGSMNEAAKEMEQIEKDLVNKHITQETMMRQQNILTRLLESEKAEQLREQEEKRESTEAKNPKISNPGQNYQYNMKKKEGQENLQLILPVLNSYYKNKVNSYIVKIVH